MAQLFHEPFPLGIYQGEILGRCRNGFYGILTQQHGSMGIECYTYSGRLNRLEYNWEYLGNIFSKYLGELESTALTPTGYVYHQSKLGLDYWTLSNDTTQHMPLGGSVSTHAKQEIHPI